jgi:ribonuclease BN (tRNA processing enzyme)
MEDPTLQKILMNGKLDLMVLSHIDNDHIIGLLDLLTEIKNQRIERKNELIEIKKIWHNSFNDLLELPSEPKKFIRNIFSAKSKESTLDVDESLIMKGFQQGTDLTNLAKFLKIPINPEFDKTILVNDKIKSIKLKDLSIHILGPTKKNLEQLRKEWKKWLGKKTSKTAVGIEILDKSIPNLASITFLAKIKNNKILFTGDGIGHDIVDLLSKNAMLDKNGKFYVDILKVPHHGSDRNTSPDFFDTVISNYYIISANGRDDNPSLNTLRWIIEGRKTSQDTKKIIFTNITPNVKKILEDYDQSKYHYEIIVLKGKSHFVTINLK